VITDTKSSHAIVSDHAGTSCGVTNRDVYIENCGYDSLLDMLGHVTGRDLVKPNYASKSPISPLSPFDQDEFFGGNALRASMDDTGYVFVPNACQGTEDVPAPECLLHMHFHGCQVYANRVRNTKDVV